jgi:hypothetical protein
MPRMRSARAMDDGSSGRFEVGLILEGYESEPRARRNLERS